QTLSGVRAACVRKMSGMVCMLPLVRSLLSWCPNGSRGGRPVSALRADYTAADDKAERSLLPCLRGNLATTTAKQGGQRMLKHEAECRTRGALQHWLRTSLHKVLRKCLLLCTLLLGAATAQAQGTLEQIKVNGPALAGNLEGNASERDVFVY